MSKSRSKIPTDDDIVEKQDLYPSKQIGSMDSYDRARQAIAFMSQSSVSGHLREDTMAMYYAVCALTEALLAVADSIYFTKDVSRSPTTSSVEKGRSASGD